MQIRRADENDIPEVLRLLSQVLEVHAKIRPDIFIPGTTKYGRDDLAEMFSDDDRPVYVAVSDDQSALGYVFCQIREPSGSPTMIPRRTLFIDDLCVDERARGQHVGSALFDHAVSEAKRLSCGEVTLNVWEGNDAAVEFYRAKGMKPRETCMEYML